MTGGFLEAGREAESRRTKNVCQGVMDDVCWGGGDMPGEGMA